MGVSGRYEYVAHLEIATSGAAQSGQSNKLYVDHLIYAFTLRLFLLGQDRKLGGIAVGF